MLPVKFIQYLRPHGRRIEITISLPESVALDARDLMARGYALEAEVLTTGMVSMTVSDGETDIAGELVENGPGVQEAVVQLIQRATAIAKASPQAQ